MAHGSSPSPHASHRPPRIDAFLREAEAFLATRGLHESGRNGMALPALAYQHGLTRDEYDAAMEVLYAKTSAPPAPPLPNLPAASEPASPHPQPPPPTAADDHPEHDIDDEPLISAEIVDHAAAPSPENPFPQVRPQDLFRFVHQGRLILTDERGWSERTLARLNFLADQLLIPHDVRPALYRRLDDLSFQPPPPTSSQAGTSQTATSQSAGPAGISSTMEIDEAADDETVVTADIAEPSAPPAPPPPKPRRTPGKLYAQYLRKAFEALPSQRINPRREQKFILEGTSKLGLSEVLARDLLLEVAEREGYVVVSQSERPEESDDHDAQEERLTTFQQRAATIIAGQGGVTSIARVMIAQAAADLGLSELDRDAALASIQKQSEKTEAETRLHQRTETYREFIRGKLQSLDHGIVVASFADKLVLLGIDLHGLSEETAWSALREVVREEELRLVTLDQAQAHVSDLADEMLDEQQFLSIEGRQRLLAEGEQWGLSAGVCQQLMEDRVIAFDQRRRRGQRQVAMIFAAFFALLIFGGGYAIYLGSLPSAGSPATQPGAPTTPPDHVAGTPGDVTPGETRPSETRWRRQPWWSEALALNLLELYQSEPALQDRLKAICAEDPQARASAYRSLLPRLVTTSVARTGSLREEVREVVVGLAHDEPSDEAVEAIAATLTEGVSLSDTDVNATTPFSQLLEKAYMSVAAARQSSLSPARREMFLSRLSQQLGISFAGSAEPLELTINEMIREQYRKLRELSASNANLAAQLHAALSEAALAYLPADQVVAKDATLAADILGRMTDEWAAYEKVVQRVVQSQQTELLLPLLDAFEQTLASSQIQQQLALLLSRRIGRSVDPDNPAQGASLVRTQLGLDSVIVRDGEMYRTFARRSSAFTWEVPADSSPQNLIADVVQLSHLSVLGHAAAEGDLGKRVFQTVLNKGVPELEPDGGSAPAPDPPPRVLSEIDALITRLHRATDPMGRVNLYRDLTRLSGDASDVRYTTSARLVEYLLAPKPRAEQKQLVSGLRAFSHWNQVKLALADQLPEARRATDDLQEVVSGLVGETIVLNNPSAARDELREILLRHALDGLDARHTGTNSLSPALANEAARLLTQHYQQHAALAGIVTDASATSVLPDVLAKQLVDDQRSRLEAMPLTSSQQARLQEITHREIALASLSDSPLANLAVRQRIWFDLLRLRISLEEPQLAGPLERLAQELEDRNAQAGSLIVQLRNGELALVKLWELKGGSA